jgi:hypothetical protein
MHVISAVLVRRNCEWLIKTVIVYLVIIYYKDNCSNSRANTCVVPTSWKGLHLLDTSQSVVYHRYMVIHNN